MKKYNKFYYQRGKKIVGLEVFIKLLTLINMRSFRRNLCENDNILEIGCGEGKVCNYLSKYNFNIEAVDISEDAIRIAKSHNSKVKYLCGDLVDLRLKSSSYDTIFSLHVMEHIKDIDRILKEIRRLLKMGGKFIARIPNRNSIEAKLAGKNWFHRDELYHVHHWTDYEFALLLKKAGFEVININYGLVEYKQVLLYSILNYFGIGTNSIKSRLILLPLQIIFMPLSWIIGKFFKNSGTIEVVAVNI